MTGKADFNHMYDRPDPREYFRTLGGLDYEIPQLAQPVFDQLLAARAAEAPQQEPVRVLDVCCSYGINAALLRCDVTLDDLFDRYTSPALDDVSSADLADSDADFYAERQRPDAVQVSGLDAAPNAVSYGERVGLLEHAWAEDLEAADPSAGFAADLATIDLVTMAGGSSYVTERTFGRVADAAADDEPPWVATFVLRTTPYDHIAGRLSEFGMLTVGWLRPAGSTRPHAHTAPPSAVASRLSSRRRTGSASAANCRESTAASSGETTSAASGAQHGCA